MTVQCGLKLQPSCSTGAMLWTLQSAIDMVKHEIQALAQQVSQLGRVRRLRLAYVACADFADRLPVQTFAFTDSLPAFHSFVSSLQLQYGFDAAEDVFSGLEVTNLQLASALGFVR